MEAKDYLKSKNIWLGTTVADMKAPENHYSLEKMLEQYHQAKLKLLGLHNVSQQRELLELVTEIANSKQVYSNTRHKLWAKKLISSNCG